MGVQERLGQRLRPGEQQEQEQEQGRQLEVEELVHASLAVEVLVLASEQEGAEAWLLTQRVLEKQQQRASEVLGFSGFGRHLDPPSEHAQLRASRDVHARALPPPFLLAPPSSVPPASPGRGNLRRSYQRSAMQENQQQGLALIRLVRSFAPAAYAEPVHVYVPFVLPLTCSSP